MLNLGPFGAAELRVLPLRQGEPAKKVWRLVKADPPAPDPKLGALAYARAPRAYGVLPDRPGEPNPTPGPGFELGPELAVYTVDAATVADLTPMLTQFRGHLGFLAPAGTPDLVHVTWDPHGQGVPQSNRRAPIPGHVHTFCAPAADPLAVALAARGLHPTMTATIVHHRMGRADWRFVQTTEF